jgi:glycerol-3-phosphate dehydrogenase
LTGEMMEYDVVIIGGGIYGCLCARELSKYRVSVLVVEKASDIGEGATKANSGVLYAGFHPRGGSLKGRSCAAGNAMHRQLCSELDVPMEYTGSLFVAFHEEGIRTIRDKMDKGRKNGVPEMKMITGDQARKLEPGLSQEVKAAMYCPTTGIISPFKLVMAAAENAAKNGVNLRFNTEIQSIAAEGDGYVLRGAGEEIRGKYVINAAGEESAIIEGLVRERDLVIKPRRGEYLVFDAPSPIKHVIYQAQEDGEKGTLMAPTTDGQLLVGPTSDNPKGSHCTQTTKEGIDHISFVAKKIMPGLDMGKVIATFAGVRANIVNVPKEEKDFVIRRSAPGFISMLGIKNPGLTASPYLVKKMVELLFEEGMPKEENPDFDPIHRFPVPFLRTTPEEQAAMMKKDRSYLNLICRCENITEGDVLRQLKSHLPPRNLNGLKKRMRVGMGRCQGGFCTPHLIEIMSRELEKEPFEICKGDGGSNLVKGRLR